MKHCSNESCPHLLRFERVAEYRDEFSTCSDCGGALAWGEVPSDEGEPAYRDLVTVYEAPTPIRGHVFRAVLTAREIPAAVLGDALGGAIGELPVTVQFVRVQVPPAFAERARALAEAFDRGELDERPLES